MAVVHALKALPWQNVGGAMQVPAPLFWQLLQAAQAAGWTLSTTVMLYDPDVNASHPFGVFTQEAPAGGAALADFNLPTA